MKDTLSRLKVTCAALLTSIIGTPAWKRPPWLAFMNKQAQVNPWRFWTFFSGFIACVFLISYSFFIYINQPHPPQIIAKITGPAITPLITSSDSNEKPEPQPLIINFGLQKPSFFTPQPVAPIQAIGQAVTEGLSLSPSIPGEWVWVSDSRLVFTPKIDWPAGQNYTLHFKPSLFTSKLPISQLRYTFATQAFEAKISDFKFYQDPVQGQQRKAIATVQFNFPVDKESLEHHTSLADTNAVSYPITITYDKYARTAYVMSNDIKLSNAPRTLLLTIDSGTTSQTGSAKTKNTLTKTLVLPDALHYLTINQIKASIVRNELDRPGQVLTIETSIGVTDAELKNHLQVMLLPENYPANEHEDEKKHYVWSNPGEVTPSIIALATPLSTKALVSEHHYSNLHSYQFNTTTPRYIYLRISKGLRGLGGFTLATPYETVIPVPELPKEISFLHKGALLALSSEKKLSVNVRGVPAVKFQIARVLPENLNQLITQTSGDFNNPAFINPSFNQQNISTFQSEIQTFDASDLTKQHYTTLDLGKYLNYENNTSSLGPKGLFLLQAIGWDNVNNTPLAVKTSRLILVTDLGVIVKDNQEGTHDVFVQSISQGLPVTHASVTLLGKNGLPILKRETNENGQAHFPTVQDFIDDQEPTVYVVSQGQDISFIPFNKPSRQLNFSRFDIGGLYTNNNEAHHLSAYLFSDRGVYRPGDNVHIGFVIKQNYANQPPVGLTLQATIIDPRGNTIKEEALVIPPSGFQTLDFTTQSTSLTGQYQINLYLVNDKQTESLLGTTSIRVAEFLPDRMRITSTLSEDKKVGWISPNELKATVNLWNLYGAPATDHRVQAKILLTPHAVEFTSYPDYHFFDPLFDPRKPTKVYTDTLVDQQTNAQGQATFNLDLNRFEHATYQLSFSAEGFEMEGGRSVHTELSALVSPLNFLVGYKSDGELNFLQQNSTHRVNFIAIDPQLKPRALTEVTLQLIALTPVSTLIKNANGSYQYQSIIQRHVVSSTPILITEKGTDYTLATTAIGGFEVVLLDKDKIEINRLAYHVVGKSQKPLAKNAELSVQLDHAEYKAGTDIQLQITAPYTGAGLITIERDKVYASTWFKTDSLSSLQTIHIPEDFQGNGYVNVSFVRDWDSPELFISPLSYSVVPFNTTHEEQTLQVNLETPALARPGEALTIHYSTDKPSKIILFAVDEGILQVAHYKAPDPLGFFFQKHALEVLTQQTVDQILPKFLQAREISAAGGDSGEGEVASHLNPFKRKTDLPVVYWSGLLDSNVTPQEVQYTVPDYFNGTLSVMAVAVSDNAMGANEKQTIIKGNFVINPNVPTFLTPGDSFNLSASIANFIKDSGDKASVSIQIKTSDNLEVIGDDIQTLIIPENQEKAVHFKLRANNKLGSASISWQVKLNDRTSHLESTLSVRPATTFTTNIQSGSTQKSQQELAVTHDLYPEYRQVQAELSLNPMVLLSGLQRYLDHFPYGCTEQLTSGALPLLAMVDQPAFLLDKESIDKKIQSALLMLSARQMSNGGFSYWPNTNTNDGNTFASVYAMAFLTEAQAHHIEISETMFQNGLNYLREIARQTPTSLDEARTQAYAIYLLTRNEQITTAYLSNLQLFLEKNVTIPWQADITTAYLASTYQLLKNQSEADNLMNLYSKHAHLTAIEESDFNTPALAKAQYLALLTKHFPARLEKEGPELVQSLVTAMNGDEINTLLAGFTSIAFDAYAKGFSSPVDGNLSITLINNHQQKIATSKAGSYQSLTVSPSTKKVAFNNPTQQTAFYQLTEAGFDKTLSHEGMNQGLEILRTYTYLNHQPITTVALGEEIEVHIRLRALDNRMLNHIAIIDLLPGGFEVITDSLPSNRFEYIDVREDRVIFFTTAQPESQEYIYRIKATNSGDYTVPAIFAESMYAPQIQARGKTEKIEVTQ